jgi:O-antigen/teichoic acid export membrane protein
MKRFPSWRHIWNIASYFLIPALSAVTPFLVIPVLTRTYGSSGWSSIAIAQSVGSAAAVIAELGWGVLGPQRVARAGIGERAEIYESAIATKLTSVAVLLPIAASATYFLVDEHRLAAVVMTTAFTAAAMSPSWFLVGLNRPLAIVVVEVVPRLGASIGAAVVLLNEGPLEVYGGLLLVAVLVTLVLASRMCEQRLIPRRASFAAGWRTIRLQLPVTLGRAVSVAYTALPITIVSLVSPAAVPIFASLERLMRMGLSVLTGIPSRLQSWVGQAEGAERKRRSRKSLRYNCLLGFGSAIGFNVAVPLVTPFVFSDTVAIPFEATLAMSGVVFAVCCSRGFGLSLVAEARSNWIAVANIFAAVSGTATIFVLASVLGVMGGILGEIVAEVVGLAVQAIALFLVHHLGRGKGGGTLAS